ncbi:LytTR family DNA-binding domain-containing protein [Massilia sp. ST3]|uniref:LytR/AlgR family response regulator transcription factor n=1 Tax=Massilia sp. ST3 TaxID=2824903 RepID=UPI001B827060|nr:LytTR family DNA-binding domain-containing protein [Massilia sp. ST3]MBQ5946313.1 response regulator transcription factor [Massilia sp. ST3]
MKQATAPIADDEPLLREPSRSHLGALWPRLELVDDARNGAEALKLFELHRSDIVFLDIHMPGLNSIDTARQLARRAHLVFVTVYEQDAAQAFQQGALDYLVKRIDRARLADTVERLQRQLALPFHASHTLDAMLDQLTGRLGQRIQPPSQWLQWFKASVGNSVRLIPVDQVRFIRAEEKYTRVVWDEGEALIRKSIRELAEQLDLERFVRTHRSVIVNLGCVREVVRGINETVDVHVRGSDEVLPVSRSYLHHFRQM